MPWTPQACSAMAGLQLRNRAFNSHPKWDPEDYEFDATNLTAAKASRGTLRGPLDIGTKEREWGEEAAPRGKSAVCQVPGCGKDLSEFKEYLQRYRICEHHRTLSCLVRNGVHQRFCQQCGKFQPLDEFDGEKRTCRRKLERHNARRRKRRMKLGGRGGFNSDDDEDDVEEVEYEDAVHQPSGTRAHCGSSNSHRETDGSNSEGSQLPPASPEASAGPVRRPVRSARHAAAMHARARTPTRARTSTPEPSGSTGLGLVLPGALGQVPNGDSMPQDELEALLSAPMSDADVQKVVQAAFGVWGSSKVASDVQTLLPPASQVAVAVNAVSVDLDALDLDLDDLSATLVDLPPAPLPTQQSPAAIPVQSAAAAASSSPAVTMHTLGAELAWQAQRVKRGPGNGPRSLASPLLGPIAPTTGPSSSSGGSGCQPPSPLPLPQLAQPSLPGSAGMLGREAPQVLCQQEQLHGYGTLQPNFFSTASSNFGAAAPAAAPAAASAGASAPALADECIANDEFDTVLAELFGEEGAGKEGFVLTSSQMPPLAAARLLGAPPAPLGFLPASSTFFSANTCFGSAGTPAGPVPNAIVPNPNQPAAWVWSSMAGAQPAPLQVAVGMLSGAQAPQPAMQDRLVRVSMKMFQTTPDLLPAQLRAEVVRLVDAQDAMVEGFLRPGCVHLTLNALLDQASLARLQGHGVRTVVETLLADVGMASLRERTLLLQLGDELAVVEHGQVVQVVSVPGSVGIVPVITSISPLAVGVGDAAQRSIIVRGRNLVGPYHRLLCRHQGAYPLLEIIATSVTTRSGSPLSISKDYGSLDPLSPLAAAGLSSGRGSPTTDSGHVSGGSGVAFRERDGEGGDWIEFQLPTRPLGLVEVEVQRGAFLSRARPLLLLPCARAAAELNELLDSTAGCSDRDGLLESIGLTLRILASTSEQGGMEGLTAADTVRGARCARAAAAVAAFRGWSAVMRLVLPAVALDCSAEAAVAAMDTLCPPGQSLLHTAVASASKELIGVLGEWASSHCLHWKLAVAGAGGVTPLHLAGLLRCPQLLRAVWELDSATAKQAWTSARALDGLTPAQYAQLAKTAQGAPASVQPVAPAPSQAQALQQCSQLVKAVQGLTVSQPAAQDVAGLLLENVPSSSLPPPLTCPAAGARPESPGASCSSVLAMPCKGKASQTAPLPSAGLDLLFEAVKYIQGGGQEASGMLAKIGEQEAAWAAVAEGPIKPHARRPALPGGTPPVPEWVTHSWTQDETAASLVASLREGLDAEVHDQVQHLLRQF